MPATDKSQQKRKPFYTDLPNENPDIENAQTAEVIPVGVANLWHSHKRQGHQPSAANVLVPGSTFAMIVPVGYSEAYLLIRTDLRDGTGVSTSTVSLLMNAKEAMAILNESYIQTRIQG